MKKSKIKNRLRQFDKKTCESPKNVLKISVASTMLSPYPKKVIQSFSEFESFGCKIIAKPMISCSERLGARGGGEAPQDHRTVPRIDSEFSFCSIKLFLKILDRVVKTLACE